MRWYIARTFSGAEWQAYKALLRRGVRSYLPYWLADARRGRWQQGAVKPQFPTYLFAGLESGESTQAILSTVGVRELLRNGVEIVVLQPGQIAEIRDRCLQRYRESVPRCVEIYRWQVGDVVSVPYGPFAGLPVQITTIDKSGRVSASIGNLDVVFHVGALPQSVRGVFSHAPNKRWRA